MALGDVAGKASPAALLMALLLAMMRTLVDEGLTIADLVARLNIQVGRHAPPSRFITLFVASYDPRTGNMQFVNAGQTPPLLRRQNGTIERLITGGIALGMFEGSTYDAGTAHLEPGDALVMYSDGITEAEDPAGVAVRRSRPGAHAWRCIPALSRSDGGQRRAGDFRRGRAPSARFAAGRRPVGAGAEPAQKFDSLNRRFWRLIWSRDIHGGAVSRGSRTLWNDVCGNRVLARTP